MSGRLTIARSGLPLPLPESGETVVGFDEFGRWVRTGKVLAHLGRYTEGRLLVHRLESSGRPLPLALALRALCRGQVFVEDMRGRRRPIGWTRLMRWVGAVAGELLHTSSLVRSVERSLASLEQQSRAALAPLDLAAPPVYLRTDLSFGVRAGGSVGHIAGVVNELGHVAAPPIFVTTDEIATLDPDVETYLVEPAEAFWNFKELPAFVLNDRFDAVVDRALHGRRPAFIYQRYSLNNYAGIRIARHYGVPLVLEYNGSEIWMSRHWGRPLKYESLSERIERLNLASADLMVVVSQATRDELTGRGVDPGRVLVNPNGVDPCRYRPEIDGRAVRTRYGIGDEVVIGFIGTFGPWHGADVLARAFVTLHRTHPELARSLRLMMIGDGATLPSVRQILSDGDVSGSTVFTGLVSQEHGAEHLAACDVLVLPHVRNPDGTPFFGSPTKLFEYMAMGKGIVASDLDQIGDVLEHGRTAWVVPPGDVDALSAGVGRLAADAALRAQLGGEARRQVVAHHTWHQHTRRIVERLQEMTASTPAGQRSAGA